MKSSGVQAVINDEDRNVSNAYNTDHMLITCDNATDNPGLYSLLFGNQLRFQIFPLVIILQLRDTTDCLGPLSETLHW
jgi:hypothetical protein